MPTPAPAAIVAMGTPVPSRCTAAVAARTRIWRLRAASLRGSRELVLAMCLFNPQSDRARGHATVKRMNYSVFLIGGQACAY
jgi:hypothetical protein